MGRAGAADCPSGRGAVAPAAGGEIVRLEGRRQQQCGRGLHPRGAQKARRRADPERARGRLPGAQGMRLSLKLQSPHSLRTRLLRWLFVAILLTAVTQATVAYLTAQAEADVIFDYQMQQMALSLRSALPISADGPVMDKTRIEDGTDFFVQVWTASGSRVFQTAARVELPVQAVLGFSDLKVKGATFRVFSLKSQSQTIQVAQDRVVRRQMASTLALRTVAPIAVMAPLLMLVAWWAVGSSLVP